jgi:hypothetical protein
MRQLRQRAPAYAAVQHAALSRRFMAITPTFHIIITPLIDLLRHIIYFTSHRRRRHYIDSTFLSPIDTPYYATPPIAFAAFHYYWLRH